MPKKAPAKRPAVRKLQKPKYKSFRLAKKIKQPALPVPSSFALFADVFKIMKRHWKVYAILSLAYLVLTVVLVRGFSVSIGAADIKVALTELFEGGELLASVTLFGLLIGSSGASSGEAASVYQGMVLTLFSLATIWILRQFWSDKKRILVREGFYQGMYPLVPFIAVLFIIGLQLMPLYVASFIAGIVYGTGLAVTQLEQVLWAILLVLLVILSLYMLCSSIFALFIVTIPKTMPIQAIKAASELVRYRRLIVLRRLLFLPFALLVTSALIIFPLIVVSPIVAEWTFLVVSALALPVSLTYLYGFYRELLP